MFYLLSFLSVHSAFVAAPCRAIKRIPKLVYVTLFPNTNRRQINLSLPLNNPIALIEYIRSFVVKAMDVADLSDELITNVAEILGYLLY